MEPPKPEQEHCSSVLKHIHDTLLDNPSADVSKLEERLFQLMSSDASSHFAGSVDSWILPSDAMEHGAREHKFIGDQVKLSDENGAQVNSSTMQLSEDGLTFGLVIALAGDYFGDPDRPISSLWAKQHPARVYSSNLPSKLPPLSEEVLKPMKLLYSLKHETVLALATTFRRWHKENNGLSDKGVEREIERILSKAFPNAPSMLKLAASNMDHFSEDAKRAYLLVHQHAICIAAKGVHMLKEAYFYEAYAAHFLTDLFASGHIRTPRRALHELKNASLQGDVLSNFMHDAENIEGLRVHVCPRPENCDCKDDGTQEAWRCYGDYTSENDSSKIVSDSRENLRKAVAVLQLSVNEVYAAALTRRLPKKPGMAVLSRLPIPFKDSNPPPICLALDSGDVCLTSVITRESWPLFRRRFALRCVGATTSLVIGAVKQSVGLDEYPWYKRPQVYLSMGLCIGLGYFLHELVEGFLSKILAWL